MHASLILAGAGFEAARQLTDAADPRLLRLHGHSFRVLARADSTHTDSATLQAELAAAIAPYDYRLINDTSSDAADLPLAREIAERLSMPASIMLRSAPEHGVVVENGTAFVWLDSFFEAAHHLPHVPAGHKCGRLHGHGFGVRLVADAAMASLADVKQAWSVQFARLNHRYLNDIAGLENPTSEVMAAWLYRQLADTLPGLRWVEVRETHTAGSQFDGQTFRIWKEQRFESAVPFDEQGNYTGHSYLIRLMLSGNLDTTMGWVLDFGDVKDRFKPLYRQLDHNPLDKLAGVRDGSSASVAEWVHAHLAPLVPELSRIDIMDNDDSGISLTFRHDMHWPLVQR